MPLFGGGGDDKKDKRAERDAEQAAKWDAYYGKKLAWAQEWGAAGNPFVERISCRPQTLWQAYGLLREYVAALGLLPEDTYGVHLEAHNSVSIEHVVLLYRDRPEYAQRRPDFWARHRDLAPEVIDPSVNIPLDVL
jgi:hypothetical protein